MDPRVPSNIVRHLFLLVAGLHLIACQEKSIVDKDNNIVLMPRDDLNISLAIDGFDNSTFGNIAQLLSDKLFNTTASEEEATETTTVAEDEEIEEENVWDPDMFNESSDNSTSELEDIFNHKAEQNKDSDIAEEFADNSITTPITSTTKMSFIQKVPRRKKPYPSASRRRREAQLAVQQNKAQQIAERQNKAKQNHFLWNRAAPTTSVSQIENTQESGNNTLNGNQRNATNSTNLKSISTEKLAQLGWVSHVLTEAMFEFSPILSNNSLCRAHSQMYLTHLRNLTFWALKMMDASTITPSGLLAANMYQLGNFDECVNVRLPHHKMQGQYCLASASFSPTRDSYEAFHDDDHSRDFDRVDEFNFVWDTVKDNINPARISRNTFYWALCIPSSCTTQDLKHSLDQALNKMTSKYHIKFNVTVPGNSCYVRAAEQEYPTGFWVFTSITLFLVSLVSMATFYDLVVFRRQRVDCEIESERRQFTKKWLIPFSGLSNMEKLGSPNEQEEFSVIHALKVITMCQVIIGHRNMNVLGNVMFNPEFTEEKSPQLAWSYFNNGTLVVDTFFLIGGFLTLYFMFQELEKRKGRINYLVVFLYRFIRVTPVYAFVIFFYIYVLPHMNDGPLWRDIIGRESSRCAKNWWTNLLYINNYIHEDEQCMVQSWYLSCDFHFFIAGTFLTYLTWRYRQWAMTILSVCLAVFVVWPFSFVYENGYWGHYRTYISKLRDPPSNPEFQSLYIKSHFRAIPYIMGMIVAYIFMKLKEKKYKFSSISMWSISLCAFFLGNTPFLLAWLAYIPGRPYYRLEQALFNPLQRLIWSSCVGWIIIGHGTTGFGPLSRILGHRVFVPFSRLTFCAFLIHVVVQLMSIATMRTPIYVSYTGQMLSVFGDLMFTFFCAFLFNIMIESPLDRFQKRVIKSLMGGFGKGSSSEQNIKEEIIDAAFQEGLKEPNAKPSAHQTSSRKDSEVVIEGVRPNDVSAIYESNRTREENNSGSDQCHL